jgi:predicted Rossmann-fold nucleotide-binding protein
MTLDSSAFIYFPGGFGTFDELFEILALMQTKKIERTPVVLVGSEFWRPFDTAIRDTMLDKYHTIEYEETELYRIYDNYDEIVDYINESYRKDNS